MASSETLSGSSLVFYPQDHTYWSAPGRDGGRLIPNVTTILRAVRVSADFEQVEKGTLEYRRQLGTAVHADCHALDDGDLDWATVDPRVRPYVDAWQAFRDAKRLVPIARERRVYHRVFDFCGTLDGIFLDPDGRHILGDIKIGDPDDAAAHLQSAAYQAAYCSEHPDAQIAERWSVQLCPDRAVPYRICTYTDFRDFHKFQACLTVYADQPARRRRIR